MRTRERYRGQLTQFPQYYEPFFLERDHKGRTVSIVDEWCCGYRQGHRASTLRLEPFIEASRC